MRQRRKSMVITFVTGSAVLGAAMPACSGSSGAAGNGGNAGGAGGGAPVLTRPWDWAGVVGTGQSLAVGQMGTPAATTSQPYHNLKLSTGTLPWPVDPNDATLAMVPLSEPIGRSSMVYPSSWPTNIAGETPHASMADQITAMAQAADGGDYVGVHGEVGENGQGIVYLRKNAAQVGVNGHAYQATLIETQAITRLAAAMGKTYGVGAIIVTHGESDSGNTTYESDLYQLWSDYQADLPALTGQTQKIQMIVSQQNAVTDRAASTLAEWKIGVDHPGDVVCSGPKYQYPYFAGDHVHLITDGYRQLGEKYGQIYFERVVLGHDWQPLAPTTVARSDARTITVHFHVPVPPLAWESTFDPPHRAIPEWQAGNGFELRGPAGHIAIASVALSGDDAVQITAAADLPATGLFVGYALTGDAVAMATPFVGTFRWGLLRDSDPFVGAATQRAQPNYLVAFELPVP
ncbi:MAG TPA: dockerin [Polyangia bacterium]|nr:dockerin [Polyangia bacterium]